MLQAQTTARYMLANFSMLGLHNQACDRGFSVVNPPVMPHKHDSGRNDIMSGISGTFQSRMRRLRKYGWGGGRQGPLGLCPGPSFEFVGTS